MVGYKVVKHLNGVHPAYAILVSSVITKRLDVDSLLDNMGLPYWGYNAYQVSGVFVIKCTTKSTGKERWVLVYKDCCKVLASKFNFTLLYGGASKQMRVVYHGHFEKLLPKSYNSYLDVLSLFDNSLDKI